METIFKSVNSPIKINLSSTSLAKLYAESSSTTPSTPCSPVTPKTPHKIDPTSTKQKYSLESIFNDHGYIAISRFTTTLQGSIWKVSEKKKKQNTQIIKVTNRSLHNQSIASINGKSYSIKENIVKETDILRYLTNKQPPIQLIKYVDSFYDEYNLFLVMEDGGMCLFQFIKECHILIRKKTIAISEWHKFCKNAMKQMVDVVDWMHNVMHCCHLDISLENFAIKNMKSTIVMHHNEHGPKPVITFCDDFVIKIIDFGLAEVFTAKNDGRIDFGCNKYVGKTAYKAPKVHGKKDVFDARSADCWSLAVCFFMMFIGCAPYTKPSKKDRLFNLMMRGRLIDVLESWGVLEYVSPEMCDLLLRLFVVEKYRLTVADIRRHCWFNPQTL